MPDRSRLISVLGLLFVAVAGGKAILTIAADGSFLAAVLDLVLIGLPGLLLLYVGSWLSSTELDPDLYPRIVSWCFVGIGVMFAFLFLRAVHPGVTTPFTLGTRAIALAIGSIAGLGIGIHEARALTRERELTRRNDELERTRTRLEQRNDELTQIRGELEEAIERVEASNERLDQFASTASHDLREPLRMISKYLQLLETRYGDELDNDAAEFIGFAVDGADRMQTMVEDLLEYSRIETQGAPFEPVDLDAVLEDALTDLQVRIEESNAEITAAPLPRVRGDAGQLRQVFQNLLTNAMVYCGEEPPRVHVSAEERESAWVISVRDEGIGIGLEDQQRIFDLFARLHALDEHPGSGIGLALCHRIVERHDGTIWVDSTLGEGSTFSFTVPTSTDASPQPSTNSYADSRV